MSSAAKYGMRFDHYVGFVCPPGSTDFTAQLFREHCLESVCAVQNSAYYENATYNDDLGNRDERLTHLERGVAAMKSAQVDVVGQFGGYWSLCYTPTWEEAKKLQADLTQRFEISVVLNWVAIVEALHAVGANRISVAAGYYRKPWTAASVRFLESAGFEVLWAGDVIDQGLFADESERNALEAATRWDYPDEIVEAACVDAASRAPDCDAICQTGAGMHATYVADAVEKATGKPLVSTDGALFWSIMRKLCIAGVDTRGLLIRDA